eukprot:CAMPEP_0113853130 /NCGR_PEP_ID=MMETSP0372-20130328/6102_1 /TAXON_ID=340204 /ORGANISM="Lankesteria abbotti" /LENGTH=199 /DNA_ID=CAMNT_0000825171 /DNA_START=71 /DNA_END=670 /DNA_ORIENTATION=- /assembly_acc=CAM_ASM_000359
MASQQMLNKIKKMKSVAASDVELEVAKALVEIEAACDSSNTDLQAHVHGVTIRGAKTLPVAEGKQQVIIVCVPYRVFTDYVRPIQGRLVNELEKRTKQFVVFFAQRKIIPKDFQRRGLKFRPRSRTLQCVHNAILEDIVGPTDILGKRWRVRSDGKQLMKVQLDPRDKMTKENLEEKLSAFGVAYQSLTRKQAVFHFNE